MALPSAATPTVTSTSAPSPTPTPKPPAQVLRLSIEREPDTIDPQQAYALDEFGIIMLVFSNLLRFDSRGNLVPDMAAEMPSLSADGLTYTFKLKPNLKYSDGQPLTAANFEYAWKRQLDPEIASEYAFLGYLLVGGEAYHKANPKAVSKDELKKLRDAVGVKAVDAQTLEFKLKERAPYFLSILATSNGVPTRQDLVEKGGERWTEPATYIGNGPYVLKEWQHQSRMIFVANPNYARGKPSIERIEQFIIGDPSAALTAYLNGELESVRLDASQWAQVQSDPNLKAQLITQPGSCTFYFGFNTTKKPFDNARVRRAFAQAMDKDAYIKSIAKGFGVRADQFVPPGFPGYYADLKPLKFDANAARQELAAAGYANGKGLPDIKYSYAASERNQARATWLQTQLRDQLGVDIKLDPLDARTLSQALSSAATTPQMFFYGWCPDYPDPQDWYSVVFDSRSSASHTAWKNDKFDQLVRAADVEANPKKRDELYRQASQLLMDDAPAALMLHDLDAFLVKPYVKGATFTPLDYYFAHTTIMDVKIAPH